jgi:hypothetical protein
MPLAGSSLVSICGDSCSDCPERDRVYSAEEVFNRIRWPPMQSSEADSAGVCVCGGGNGREGSSSSDMHASLLRLCLGTLGREQSVSVLVIVGFRVRPCLVQL